MNKIYISYFYMIRFFKPNMIPLSTALWDPKWYHMFKDKDTVFFDKRGVINGYRIECLHPRLDNDHCTECQRTGDPNTCEFIKKYREQIFAIPFDKLTSYIDANMKQLSESLFNGIEAIPVLIVHEAPDNNCSERIVLREYFEHNGCELKELTKEDCL